MEKMLSVTYCSVLLNQWCELFKEIRSEIVTEYCVTHFNAVNEWNENEDILRHISVSNSAE